MKHEDANMERPIISWSEAKAKGLKRYFTGKPCIHGHVEERYINGSCIKCHDDQVARYREKNGDAIRASVAAYGKVYQQLNKDKINAKVRERRQKRKQAEKAERPSAA